MDKFQRLFGSNSTQALRNALCTFLCLNGFLRPVLLRPDYLQLHEMDKLRDLEVHGKRSGGRDGYEKKLQSEAKWLHDCTNVCGMRVFQMNHAVVWPSNPVLHEQQMPHQNKRGLHRMWWNIVRRFWPPFIYSRWCFGLDHFLQGAQMPSKSTSWFFRICVLCCIMSCKLHRNHPNT